MVSPESGKQVEGRNVSVWFPDARVADQLGVLANELVTSSSAIIVELVQRSMPVIRERRDKRTIKLDGVTVNV